jgi:hypothetical protein
MATVDGLTKARMLAIEAASVVDGNVDSNGDLILTTYGGDDINAGYVKGPVGPPASNVRPAARFVGDGTTSQSVPTASWTQIASFTDVGTDAWKQGNDFEIVSGRVRAINGGIYSAKASVSMSGNATGRRGSNIDINSNPTAAYANAFHDLTTFNSTSTAYLPTLKPVLRINPGEYFRFWVYQDSGTSLTASHGAAFLYFELVKVSDIP